MSDDNLEEDEWDGETLPADTRENEHDPLVRWTAQLLVRGMKPSQIRRKVADASLERRLAPDEWNALMSDAGKLAENMREMVVMKAELDDTDWLRLDSYARRRRSMERMERLIIRAEEQADTVSKLGQVSFMVGGLIKQQDGLDRMSGAQDAKPQVIVNIGYDPLEQMREVLQKEIIDIENKAESDDDSNDNLVDTFD
jgi:hypothetical protein